jgi:mannose-1-phosphate guanylyltransferase / mannose-6-phosphate isomerase
MTEILPVLLAGGSGTRLWPLSRKSYPKQFSNLMDKTTLFQNSALRLTTSDIIQFAPPLTLTNSAFRFIVSEQLQSIGIDPGPILIEPAAKNTAAAIIAASILAYSKDQEAILLVAPSDHVIPNVDEFHEVISAGLSQVKDGMMVTFGINPNRPETGYGYLELSGDKLDTLGSSRVANFIEKPDSVRAETMLKKDNFLWNSGIFLFSAKDMIAAFETYAKKTLDLVLEAVDNATLDLEFVRLEEESWSKISDISIDYAIMEKAKNLVAVPFKSKWSDLGGWDAVWAESTPDVKGNVTSAGAHAINCSDTLLRSESSNQQIVGIGLDNIIAVAMPDAVLVARKDRSQEVKKAVEILNFHGASQGAVFPKDHRPWGWFESLALGNRFQVKRIYVKPGASLSLQSHHHRSEHWVVVEGTAKVTIDDHVQLVTEGQSVHIPLGSKHRMENPGKLPMLLIEVQIGSYLDEDDIIRYEDQYSRV